MPKETAGLHRQIETSRPGCNSWADETRLIRLQPVGSPLAPLEHHRFVMILDSRFAVDAVIGCGFGIFVLPANASKSST